jgi:hypothetical protein
MNPLIVKINGKAILVLDGVKSLLQNKMYFTGQPVVVDSNGKMITNKRRRGTSPTARRYVNGKVCQVLKGEYGRAGGIFGDHANLNRNHRTRRGTPADRRS